MEDDRKHPRHLCAPVPDCCQKGAAAAPASCKQHVQDTKQHVGLCCCCRAHQQHTWEALMVSTTGTRSLPPVQLHCLLRQSSQQVGLVHLHGADVQHGQVSLQFLQQGAAASIPELRDRKHDCRVLLPHPKWSFSPNN